jgi:hypothetical protein
MMLLARYTMNLSGSAGCFEFSRGVGQIQAPGPAEVLKSYG